MNKIRTFLMTLPDTVQTEKNISSAAQRIRVGTGRFRTAFFHVRPLLPALILTLGFLTGCAGPSDAPSDTNGGIPETAVQETPAAETDARESAGQEGTAPENSIQDNTEPQDGREQQTLPREPELTQEGKDFLNQMCYYLPDFTDSSQWNEDFWHGFLFASYTGRHEPDVEIVTLERPDLGFSEQAAKVSLEEITGHVMLALGVQMPDYKPSRTDMPEGQTAFFYEDGYYYIGLSDFGDIRYQYTGSAMQESGLLSVTYEAYTGGEERIGKVHFTLAAADNRNGFLIRSKQIILDQ